MVKAAGAIFHLSVCLARLVNTGARRVVCDRADEILVKCIQMSGVAAAEVAVLGADTHAHTACS